MQNRVLELIATDKPIPEILKILVDLVEQHTHHSSCTLFLLDETRTHLHSGVGSKIPDDYLEEFEGFTIGPQKGSCGTAVYNNETIIVENIATNPLWEGYREKPLALGFQACWSQPITNSNNEVIGVLCLYYSEIRTPSEEDAAIINSAAKLSSIAIQKWVSEKKLEDSQANLEELVQERTGETTETIRQLQDEIVERIKVERSLKDSNEQLQNLSNHLQTIREDERARISREIHDELGQMLTALKMELSLLEDRIEQEKLPIGDDVRSMKKLTETTIQTVRRISSELRPGILDVLGLEEAVEWLAQEFEQRTRLKIQTTISKKRYKLSSDCSTALFRICQEALTNVARHADATAVEIFLTYKKNKVELKVQDNGNGITPKQISKLTSLGLIGMRERAQILGGQFSISGNTKKGTTVTAFFPLETRQ